MAAPKLRVTIDVFSGRENPVVELTGKRLESAISHLKPGQATARMDTGRLPIPTLGYRGMIVESVGGPIKGMRGGFRVADGKIFGSRDSYQIIDEAFEDFVCGSVPKGFPIPDLKLEIMKYRGSFEFWREWRWEHEFWPTAEPCRCAPIYEPGWWNVSAIQPFNNCYNYASNYRTDTFAQPGRAADQMYSSLTCASVRPAAIADKLIDSPGVDNNCPAEGHLVALVVWPGGDYHWYRKGVDGFWSHKPGGTAVTNLDNSGNPITDPRTADRGNYTDFCTFMTVKHGHVMIR